MHSLTCSWGDGFDIKCAGDVKEFGFREIPDDDNYTSSFSANVPEADAVEKQSEPEKEGTGATALSNSQDMAESKPEEQSSWFSGTSKKAASWMPWAKKEEVVRLSWSLSD